MSITIARAFPGHWQRTYTTTTTISVVNGVGSGVTNTSANDSFVEGVNQWGQSGVRIEFYNESKKDIRNVTFEVAPLNGSYFPVSSAVQLQMTTPIKSHAVGKPIWSFLWSDPSIRSVQIARCKVQYADGTSETQSQNSGDKPLIEDHSVSHPLGFPCVLFGLLLMYAIYSFVIYRGPYGIAWILPLGDSLSFTLVLIAVFAAMIFSRLIRNKTATIIASAAALALGVYGLRPRILYVIRGFSRGDSWDYLGDEIYSLLAVVGCLLFLIVLVLCAADVLKPGGKRSTFVLLAEIFLWLFLIGVYILFSPGSMVSLAVMLVFWLYLGTASLRIRSRYDVVP